MKSIKTLKKTNNRTVAMLTIVLVALFLAACTIRPIEGDPIMNTKPTTQSGYASVNGLEMYYEIHGEGKPLVLLHGAFSATDTSFGAMIPELAKTRQVISIEQQGHGRTADIDRPLTIEQMAEDTAAALEQIGIENADFFGYSMGSGIALQIALNHPELVNKLAIASVTYNMTGFHPGMLEGMEFISPEMFVGTPWHDEYMRIAPNPDDFANLVAKVTELNTKHIPDLTDEQVQQIQAPTLLIIGDSDIVRPEHAVEFFRLRGGGVNGDMAGLPNSQLAVLPGTSHTMVVTRVDWLVSMVTAFLDAPVAESQ